MYNRVIEQSVRPHDSRRVFTVQPTGAHWRTQAAGPSRQRQQSRLEQWCGVHTVEHLSSCGLGHRHLGRQPRQASKISWNNLAKRGLKSMCSKNPKTTQMLKRGVLRSCQWQAGKQDSENMRKKRIHTIYLVKLSSFWKSFNHQAIDVTTCTLKIERIKQK